MTFSYQMQILRGISQQCNCVRELPRRDRGFDPATSLELYAISV
ncbi:MAG: hypothetical protein ACRC32_20280 [Chroococcidiopsis sp.]